MDVFDDLMGLVRIFPHANLDIEVLGVTIDEVRIPRRRRPGYTVADRRLGQIHESATLVLRRGPLEPVASRLCWRRDFHNSRSGARLERPVWFAQRVAYCLRKTGAARQVGKTGNRLIYVKECG